MFRDAQVRLLILLAAIPCASGVRAADRAPDLLQGDGRVSAFYSWDAAIPAPGQLLRQEKLEPTLGLAKAGAQYRILYSSTDGIDGKSANVLSALLLLPPGEPPAGGWPLLAWGHETAGMADICAPSWVGYSPRIEAFLNAWLARGIAVVATDYQGLGTVGPHPYMAVRPGAYGMLDSVRAVEKSFPAIGRKVLLAGYSQGAGAAFGAAALQPSYAADIDIRGVLTTGISYTTPETIATMRDATANQASYTLIYPLYIALVAQQFDPALKETDMFSDKALPLFEATRHACLGQLVIDVLSSGLTRTESVKPGYAAALDKILPWLQYPSVKLAKPVFMGIGEMDSDAPAHLQLTLAKNACAAGTIVEAHLYAGGTHDAAVALSLPAALRFADKLLAGEAITPVCAPEDE
jgi:pimeloyl-ACP methyl ester carboxylesterase